MITRTQDLFDRLDPETSRMLANAVRQVIVTAEGASPVYATALSEHDTLDDFRALHRRLSKPFPSA